MTRRRWIAEHWTEETAILTGTQADHLARVLRAQPGAEADIVAGSRVFRASILSVAPEQVSFQLLDEVHAFPALPVTLVLSIYKFDRMEWAIEKLTELGASVLAPVIARRTEKHLGLASAKRVERWRRIAHEAAQQSRRSDVPVIEDPVPLSHYIRQSTAAAQTRIVLAEQEKAITLRTLVEQTVEEGTRAATMDAPSFALAVGPEGGWAAEEGALFQANGWRAASLGPRILRAETAAIAAVSALAALLD